MTPQDRNLLNQLGATVLALTRRVSDLQADVARLQVQVARSWPAKARAQPAAPRQADAKVLGDSAEGGDPVVGGAGSRPQRPRTHILQRLTPPMLAVVERCADAGGITPAQLVAGSNEQRFIVPRNAAIVELLALPMSVSALARLLDRDRKTNLRARRACAGDDPDPAPAAHLGLVRAA